jgi:predicted RNA-binding protein YlxR (DUF448 family)
MSRKAAQKRREITRGGDHGQKGDEPLRRCLATGESLAKERLVRFVAGPDGVIVPDLGNDLPGRGAWVTADAKALAKVLAKGGLAKTLEAKPMEGLAGLVETLLVKRALALLGLAKRAGLVLTGFERVTQALDGHDAGGPKVVTLPPSG